MSYHYPNPDKTPTVSSIGFSDEANAALARVNQEPSPLVSALPAPVLATQPQKKPLTNEQHIRKIRFISRFLAFANTVAPVDNRIPTARMLEPGHETYHQKESNSRVITLKDDPNRQDMGASVTAYRTGFTKRSFKRLMPRFISLGTHVHAADVITGTPNKKADGLVEIIGSSVVLRMTEYPPTILYDTGQGTLMSVEPDTNEWNEVAALANSLYDQASAFDIDQHPRA